MDDHGDEIQLLRVGTDSRLSDPETISTVAGSRRLDIESVETLDTAVRTVAAQPVDCIVADYELAAGDGLELLETIRADYPELPFVLCTDGGSERLASDAISAGVDDYIQPARSDTDLTALIERVTDLAEAYRADRVREQELERAADLLAKTERIAAVGGWEIDPATNEVFWTDNLFSILGLDGDEPSLSEALEVYHEEDQPLVESAIETAIETGEPFDLEARFWRSDGDLRWLRVQGEPTVEDGVVTTLRGAVEETTERRTRERLLRNIHDIIADQSQPFDEQISALLELGRGELGTKYGTLSKITDEEYVFEVVASDDDSIAAGEVVPLSSTNCETVATTERTVVLGNIERDAPAATDRDGFAEWGIRCYLGAPVFVDDEVYGTFCFYDTEPRVGQFSEWEKTVVDLMSRWVSYELQRRRATEQLQTQNEQLERFASIVSHDLRNPLSIAEGYVDLALETGEVDELSRAKDAIERMDTLIDDVLLLSRSEREIERSTVDLRSLAEGCWETVPTETAALSVETDRRLRADQTRLKQLLENLFRNSVEHGGDGVTISVGDLTDGFYLQDDGPGIPPDERETVFKSGYSSTDDGTGLGLSIVSEIADAHGWDVRVTEGADGGARFEFTGVETAE